MDMVIRFFSLPLCVTVALRFLMTANGKGDAALYSRN
jgi:hypothetical protein